MPEDRELCRKKTSYGYDMATTPMNSLQQWFIVQDLYKTHYNVGSGY